MEHIKTKPSFNHINIVGNQSGMILRLTLQDLFILINYSFLMANISMLIVNMLVFSLCHDLNRVFYLPDSFNHLA